MQQVFHYYPKLGKDLIMNMMPWSCFLPFPVGLGKPSTKIIIELPNPLMRKVNNNPKKINNQHCSRISQNSTNVLEQIKL